MNEFEFIKNIKNRFSLKAIGDDCAILPKDAETDMAVTADMLIENIDFRLDWTTPQLLGHKALAVSLSDLAAVGAEPRWAMLSIAIPEFLWNAKFLDPFYDGWHDLASVFGVELVGGDISRTDSGLVIDSTVAGDVPRGSALMRSGARPGDGIYVSGPLGSAAGGLRMLENGERLSSTKTNALLMKQLKPEPRVSLGTNIRSSGVATAMIDLSDGLSSDLAHICSASGVGAVVNANDLPFDGDLMTFAVSIDTMLDLALNGGEDFELLFTASNEEISALGLPEIFRIGEVTANVGVIELNRNGANELLPPKGFRHF
jgi:thiamine-monophosphate kinase